MAKEWILNSAMNRFQMNFKRNVGAVSESIRKCSPKTVDEWREYYFKNVRSEEHIKDLGRRLYIKITEVISAEVADVTEEDCIVYLFDVVINRTFDGYMTEITTIYGQLEHILNTKIEPAPDKWDRLFNVDFFIKINEKYIGLQIKPASDVSHIPQIYQERSRQIETHKKFTSEYGGKVFYIISMKDGIKKVIHNKEIIPEIEQEIKRLRELTRSIHKYPLSRKKNGKAQGFGIRLKNSSDSSCSGRYKNYNKLTSMKLNFMNFSG